MNQGFRDYLVAVSQIVSGYRTRGERNIANERLDDIREYLDVDHPLRILDLANGRLRPQYILLRADHHQVYGIDLVNRPAKSWTDIGYRLARWIYSLHIQPVAKAPQASRIVCGDVGLLPFANNFFDLVTSVAAFEHFLDVPAVVAELYRVMRPGGVAYIRIHLFTSLSGGHSFSLMEIPLRTIPKGVDAWDHLRKRCLPLTVPLNEWRIDQYLEEFSRHFEILKNYCAMREGEHLLTPEIEAELSDYRRDELTCGTYIIVARKPF